MEYLYHAYLIILNIIQTANACRSSTKSDPDGIRVIFSYFLVIGGVTDVVCRTIVKLDTLEVNIHDQILACSVCYDQYMPARVVDWYLDQII
ncbi:hypothetical protein KC19_6G195800 [Ceratodon purpureus]|uniref:Uncharacterized protein n=1 Tax=Ceratodon purpureus TaxID=3225 RepID=A0A8T0HJD4_CERPU|nr:hypothetical protein KC19_6G195800 [Ceratodon purpureus]